MAKIVIDAPAENSPQVMRGATMRAPAQQEVDSSFAESSRSTSKIPQIKNFERFRANSQQQKRRNSSKSKLRNPTVISLPGALADATEKNVNKYQN